MKIFSLFLGLSFIFLAYDASAFILNKTGTLIRYEATEYKHCWFVEDGEKEEMDLWPAPDIDCQPFVGKKVHVIFNTEKMKVQGMYGTVDVLRLTEIKQK